MEKQCLEWRKNVTYVGRKAGVLLENTVCPYYRGFSGSYRFGYQGSEKDNEVSGDGNSYTTEFRQLDPRLGRWFSVDPWEQRYPYITPYASMHNNPISLTDRPGLGPKDPNDKLVSSYQENSVVYNLYKSQDGKFYVEITDPNYVKSTYVEAKYFNGNVGEAYDYLSNHTSELYIFYTVQKAKDEAAEKRVNELKALKALADEKAKQDALNKQKEEEGGILNYFGDLIVGTFEAADRAVMPSRPMSSSGEGITNMGGLGSKPPNPWEPEEVEYGLTVVSIIVTFGASGEAILAYQAGKTTLFMFRATMVANSISIVSDVNSLIATPEGKTLVEKYFGGNVQSCLDALNIASGIFGTTESFTEFCEALQKGAGVSKEAALLIWDMYTTTKDMTEKAEENNIGK